MRALCTPRRVGINFAELPVASNAELSFGRLIHPPSVNRRPDMKRTLIVGVALALAPALSLAADDTKKKADSPGSGTSIQSEPLPALDKDAEKKAAEKAGQKKGAAGPAGPAGSAGAPGASNGTSSSTSPDSSAPAATSSETKK
jgi:hypothetical protein